MERLARHPVNELSVKAEREQLLCGRFVTFDGKSDQGDILARLAPAGSHRVLGIPQYDTADPKAEPAPDTNDLTLRTDAVRGGSIAWVQAGEEIDAEDELAVGAGGKAVTAGVDTAASVSLGVVADNNALTFTAKDGGEEGNELSVTLVDPGVKEKPLVVDVDGDKIVVQLETDAENKLATSGAELITAIAEQDVASQLIVATNKGASSGAGNMKAAAEAPLVGGAEAAPAVAKAYTEGEVDDYLEVELY